MFIELVDVLRCVGGHAESLLVATANRMVERDIAQGLLGCPVCRTEYPIVDGVAHFEQPGAPLELPDPVEPSIDQAIRLAAFLDLAGDGGAESGFALLVGAWGCHARLVRSLIDQHLIVVNAPPGIVPVDGVSLILTDSILPLAPAIVRGAALDLSCGAALAEAAARAVRPGGRMLGPLTLVRPPDTTEIARDATLWVGEVAPSPLTLVPLVPRRRV